MTPLEAGYLGITVMVLLLFTGLPVGIVMAVCGFVGFAYVSGLNAALGLVKTSPYSTASAYVLSVIPLFVLMGQVAFQSGISEDLYKAAHKWFGHLPGGLAMATVISGAGFAAMCGDSAAATATFGSVALPEMRKLKYEGGYAAAAIAACGTLAILIPPSNGFIIYGVITQQSIGKLFMAGLIPGIILATLYLLSIYYTARRNPQFAPTGPACSWSERWGSLRYSWPMITLFAFVMGGIWGGVFTPSEAGALGALGSFLFLIWRGKFNRKSLVRCLLGAVDITSMIFVILVGAFLFGYFLAVTGVPRSLSAFFAQLPLPPVVTVMGILCLYFVMGFFLDMLSMVVITTPLFFPVIVALGYDPIWYGVMMVVAMEQGQLTPPMGINLFIITGFAKDVSMASVIRHIWPYVIDMFIFMFLLLAFPQLALYLPSVMK